MPLVSPRSGRHQERSPSERRTGHAGLVALFAVAFSVVALVVIASAASPDGSPSRTVPATASPIVLAPSAPTPSRPAAIQSAGEQLAVYYVAPNGDDAGPGTESSPWRTLQRAADSAEPGATVYVSSGTYAGMTVERSGTPDRPIVFDGLGPDPPVVTGEPGRDFVIDLTGVHDVVVRGLAVRGATEQFGAGIRVGPGSQDVVVSHMRVHDNSSFGILVEDSEGTVLARNEVSGSGSGIRVRGRAAGTVIERNRIFENDRMVVNDPEPDNDTGGQGIALSLADGPITVVRNEIWGNRATSTDYGRDGSAFEVFGASDLYIAENRVWDNETVMETGTNRERECRDITFVRNVGYAATTWGESKGILLRCAANTLVAHNTLVGFEDWAIQFRNRADSLFGGSIEGLRVVNNIVSAAVPLYVRDPLPDSVVVEGNVLFSGDGTVARIGEELTTDVEALERVGVVSSIIADPGFVDAGGHNYRLRAGSAAIDAAGRLPSVNDDFNGEAPDIGRYESAPGG